MGLGQMRTRGPAMAERERWLCSRWTVTAAPTPAGTRGWPVPREPPGPSARGCRRWPGPPDPRLVTGRGKGSMPVARAPRRPNTTGICNCAPVPAARVSCRFTGDRRPRLAGVRRRVEAPGGDDGRQCMGLCGRPGSVHNTRPLVPRMARHATPGELSVAMASPDPRLRRLQRATCLGRTEPRPEALCAARGSPSLTLGIGFSVLGPGAMRPHRARRSADRLNPTSHV